MTGSRQLRQKAKIDYPGPSIETTITGGRIQGVAGAGTVHIENFTIYNRTIEEGSAPGVSTEPIPTCPYPGLAYFAPRDAHLFFGRDVTIDRLVATVGRQSLTALVGASGNGKSSVVLAGLAPRLPSAAGHPARCSQPTISRWENAPALRDLIRLMGAWSISIAPAMPPRPQR